MTIQVRSNEKPQTPPTPPAAAQVEKPEHQAKETVAGTEEGQSKDPVSQSAPESSRTSEQNQKTSDSETEGVTTEAKKEEDGEDEKGEPKKKGGFQRRIDKLNAQKSQAQQELEYWKALALKNAAGGSKADINPTQPIETASSLTSEPKPNPDNYETHSEYVEALTDWKTEQKLKEREQKAQKERFDQEQSKVVESYQKRMKTFAEKTPDFHEVLLEVDHIPLTPALRDIILNSENGPELAYELAKVPGEYERLAKLPPLACAREMGKFESRLHSSSSQKASAEGTQKKITQAPKPIEPVGTGGKGSVPKSIYDPNLSQSEYEALRREQMKKRRQA